MSLAARHHICHRNCGQRRCWIHTGSSEPQDSYCTSTQNSVYRYEHAVTCESCHHHFNKGLFATPNYPITSTAGRDPISPYTAYGWSHPSQVTTFCICGGSDTNGTAVVGAAWVHEPQQAETFDCNIPTCSMLQRAGA
jgi:hypothetical protein